MSDSKPLVLVPELPTPEMIDAGRWSEYYEESSRMREVDDDEVAGVWALMLAAAPKQKRALSRTQLKKVIKAVGDRTPKPYDYDMALAIAVAEALGATVTEETGHA